MASTHRSESSSSHSMHIDATPLLSRRRCRLCCHCYRDVHVDSLSAFCAVAAATFRRRPGAKCSEHISREFHRHTDGFLSRIGAAYAHCAPAPTKPCSGSFCDVAGIVYGDVILILCCRIICAFAAAAACRYVRKNFRVTDRCACRGAEHSSLNRLNDKNTVPTEELFRYSVFPRRVALFKHLSLSRVSKQS